MKTGIEYDHATSSFTCDSSIVQDFINFLNSLNAHVHPPKEGIRSRNDQDMILELQTPLHDEKIGRNLIKAYAAATKVRASKMARKG